jgi:putative ABC transport system ATP-binding protein
MIKLENVTKLYGKGSASVTALESVNLHVKKGEYISIIGPSGSGKSTMLNILGCLDSVTAGKYLVEDRDVSALNMAQKARLRNEQFGFVFQSFNLITDKTALENVMLPLKYSRVPKKDRRQRGEKALDLMGLLELKHRYPNELSGGQQQRVAIARALVNDPKVILADEPTGNLDTKTGQDIINVLKKLNEEEGKTIILITHDVKIAAAAGRVIQVVDGTILNDDSLSDSKFSFNNPFSEVEGEVAENEEVI